MRRAGGGVPDLHNITCVSLPLQGRGMGAGVGEVGSSLAPWGDAETVPPVDPLYRPKMEALQDLRACGCQDRAAEPQTAKWSPLWPPHFPALSCAVSGTLQALLCPQGVGYPMRVHSVASAGVFAGAGQPAPWLLGCWDLQLGSESPQIPRPLPTLTCFCPCLAV